MYNLVSVEKMRELEEDAFSKGLLPIALMEQAAYAAASEIMHRFSKDKSFTVVCGKGNNGGDGLATARIMYASGYNIKIYLTAEEVKTESAKHNLELAKKFGIPFTKGICSDVVIDAIFGIGISGEVNEPAVELINKSGAYVISIDVPSGICADSGAVLKNAVQADLTLTFGYKKTGLTQYPGKKFCGEIITLPISVTGENFEALEVDNINGMLPDSKADDNKGSRGKVLIIAGSIKYLGAAKMCTLAALKSGCGLAMLMLPKNLCAAVTSTIPEAVMLPLECEDYINFNSALEYEKEIAAADSIVIGPGLTNSAEVLKILEYLADKNKPVIIDADGINSLNGNIDILKSFENVAITPHPGELARLIGCSIEEVQGNRVDKAQTLAEKNGAVVVLKGASTVTASPDGKCFINTSGNPGLATGGSGDVLAGIAGTIAAREPDLTRAMYLSVFLHGFAADLVCEKMGSEGMLPTDVINMIPYAIQKTKN